MVSVQLHGPTHHVTANVVRNGLPSLEHAPSHYPQKHSLADSDLHANLLTHTP